MMNRRLRFFLLAATLCSSVQTLIASDRLRVDSLPSPVLAFENQAVTAAGLTAGGKVAWFGQGTRWSAGVERQVRQFVTLTATSSGTSRLELPFAVPGSSVWFAVDLTTMKYGVGSPPGFLPIPIGAEGASVAHARPSQELQVVIRRNEIVGMVVRPGATAWRASGSNLGAAEGSVLRVAETAKAGETPFAAFGAGDIAFLIDPFDLHYAVVSLNGAGE
jgi:hypothetical protein